ncbi:hypothetical protein ACFFMR_22620 [Micromonospora andamanensis]|uniref:Uncharacterized protein n=1 Tax=Micromonospora andamanensis TaxID=1287068 RepID=A0ABQ4HXT6_9ACTN|nr:hypothetical protein [Micromonospora andamanensis]GIJ10454.1 hypothetical protein Van01_36680 [Micromonospora andamanensis]
MRHVSRSGTRLQAGARFRRLIEQLGVHHEELRTSTRLRPLTIPAPGQNAPASPVRLHHLRRSAETEPPLVGPRYDLDTGQVTLVE